MANLLSPQFSLVVLSHPYARGTASQKCTGLYGCLCVLCAAGPPGAGPPAALGPAPALCPRAAPGLVPALPALPASALQAPLVDAPPAPSVGALQALPAAVLQAPLAPRAAPAPQAPPVGAPQALPMPPQLGLVKQRACTEAAAMHMRQQLTRAGDVSVM